MKKYNFIITAIILLLVAGCTNTNVLDEIAPQANVRKISLIAGIPGDENEKISNTGPQRISLEQEGKNILLKWQENDPIKLVFVQGTTKIEQNVTVKSIANGGKTAHFDVNIPAEITSGTFDLYGVYGGILDNGDGDPTTFKLPASTWNYLQGLPSGETNKLFVLTFKQFEIDVNAPSVTADFQHLGSLFCIKFKNNTANDIPGQRRVDLISVDYDAEKPAFVYHANALAVYDLTTDTYPVKGYRNFLAFYQPNVALPAGETRVFWAWYVPAYEVDQWPKLQLRVYQNNNQVLANSSNTTPLRPTPLKGRAYYLYAEWDGSEVKFISEF